MHWFSAELINDNWQNWQLADFDPACQVGEFHISSDGLDLYLASDRPALNPAGDKLWFGRNFGIWRSKLVNNEWQPAERIISPLAGEPSIDAFGNIYFTHHFLRKVICSNPISMLLLKNKVS